MRVTRKSQLHFSPLQHGTISKYVHPLLSPLSPLFSIPLHLTLSYSDCSCDPISILSDCRLSLCKPFFAVFFPLHLLVLIYLVIVTVLVEYKIKQKGLWRIILACELVAQCGMLLPLFHLSISLFPPPCSPLIPTLLFPLSPSPPLALLLSSPLFS